MAIENNQPVNLNDLPEWKKMEKTISSMFSLGEEQLTQIEAYYKARMALMNGDPDKMTEFNKSISDDDFTSIQAAVLAVREMFTGSPRASHLIRRKR